MSASSDRFSKPGVVENVTGFSYLYSISLMLATKYLAYKHLKFDLSKSEQVRMHLSIEFTVVKLLKKKANKITPSTSTSILIGKAYRAVYKGTRRVLSDLQLPPAQFILLAALWEKDSQSSAQLGALLGLDSATMTGLIDRTEAKKYVKRRADPSDRRVNRVVLTKKGRDLEEPVTSAMNQFDRELAALVDGDVASFNQGLVRMGALS